MKLLVCTVAFFIAGGAFAQQQFPASLNLAVKESSAVVQDSLTINPDLSYYAKNYQKAFRQDYNLDVLTYAVSSLFMDNYRSVWYDSSTPQIFRVMPMAGVNVDAFMANPCESGYTIETKK